MPARPARSVRLDSLLYSMESLLTARFVVAASLRHLAPFPASTAARVYSPSKPAQMAPHAARGVPRRSMPLPSKPVNLASLCRRRLLSASYAPADASAANESCTKCRAGQSSVHYGGAAYCEVCGGGKFASAGSIPCTSCGAGKFSVQASENYTTSIAGRSSTSEATSRAQVILHQMRRR